MKPLTIIGAGLAGSEAAWQAAEAGLSVTLIEMRPTRMTEAHRTEGCAELVCSNSFRSDDAETNAVGLLHEEMRRCGSLILNAADTHQVPAGGALAVDRDGFSDAVTAALTAHPRITLERREVTALPAPGTLAIIATGPLTSGPLAEAMTEVVGEDDLAFFDAIAPIIHKDSIDFSKAWFQSRYDKPGPGGSGKDYLNLAMTEAEYDRFLSALLEGETTEFKEWETSTPYFEGCLPIEVMAARGRETLRFGPMKPVGLTNPHKDEKPFAVVQLRQDNALGTLFNMVGFQTKLKYGAQGDVFRLIPGLENARFARLGGIHRNTFINSPKVLTDDLSAKAQPGLRFAGQMTGVEGYLESAAIGLLAGRFAAAEARGEAPALPPRTTALGALHHHITQGHVPGEKGSFQPMNVNFGLFPPMEAPRQDEEGRRLRGKEKGRAKKRLMSARALADLESWIGAVDAAA
ncbi:glucose-inhibited division protein A [Parvularcula bermudensis HTCC2503]|uniref:Methylenetetrahydrofolate--tRNA-(uracil-5-)-methyltransferase TrmFO n=1 Tax=Parvularcula bermudensis (strain ATCC BAA-594 / HTCC2503 / KCTC 12087) TaxID=314260 RepID=E0TIG8_PARBH|nr:methylenetetrahydrofolate--tRNA-(uracil(54)-C(5))-methyltransferase (FADH(2)-oxidizing) TrmFO [Parvularcula bermudensis]ADM10287.1 glucose-inhibited division protein A [Parvularcula bermudensis HTCC2503]